MRLILFLIVCLTLLSFPILPAYSLDSSLYVTWQPLEPDRCISAWLLKTYVNSNAVFKIIEKGHDVTNGIPFDVPGSHYVRDARRSGSEAIIALHDIRDPKALALGRLARKLELGAWHATFTDNELPLVQDLREISQAPGDPKVLLDRAMETIQLWENTAPTALAPRPASTVIF